MLHYRHICITRAEMERKEIYGPLEARATQEFNEYIQKYFRGSKVHVVKLIEKESTRNILSIGIWFETEDDDCDHYVLT